MKASLECIPCFVRQVLDAAMMATDNPSHREKIMGEMLAWISRMKLDGPPPLLGQSIHRRLREISGVEDPYRGVKDSQNKIALGIFPGLEKDIEDSPDPLITAARLAIAGNILSLTSSSKITESEVRKSITQALGEPVHMEDAEFRQAVAEAKNILYLSDNAGEIVFDRLLIERLLPKRVTIGVRGSPVINDATRIDAEAAGLHEIIEIVDTGSDAPGIILEDCSPEFKRHLADADLIISKGQANFETLSHGQQNIFFLFKIKCPVIAAYTGMPIGTHVMSRKARGRHT